MNMEDFYRGKRVLVTGHTGFKGTWLVRMLLRWDAQVAGYALEPPTTPNLYSLSKVDGEIESHIADIRDFERLQRVFKDFRPQIVFHLAAQPLVKEGYAQPAYTYETNVMGTVNLLECVRQSEGIESVVNVTTDKVYLNREWEWGYRECEPLDGYDPYSNSKSCSELVTHSYKRSFFDPQGLPVSTARAGNVIGGGDFADNRIVPDCVRAVLQDQPIVVRNPDSIRPYQHVLEPLAAYLLIAQAQCQHKELADSYNVGPDDADCLTTGQLADAFCRHWGQDATWVAQPETNAPHEARLLRLDCSHLKSTLQWRPRLTADDAIRMTCEWTRVYRDQGDIPAEMEREIHSFYSR